MEFTGLRQGYQPKDVPEDATWRSFSKMRWSDIKGHEVPRHWWSNRWLLPLIASEYRRGAKTPRAGEKPRNPGRLRKIKSSIKVMKKNITKMRKVLANKEALKRQVMASMEKLQKKMEKLEHDIGETSARIANSLEDIQSRTQHLPVKMRVNMSPKKRKQCIGKKKRENEGGGTSVQTEPTEGEATTAESSKPQGTQ